MYDRPMYICMNMRTCIHVHGCMTTYICIYVCMCIMHAWLINTNTQPSTSIVCLHVWMNVNVCKYVHLTPALHTIAMCMNSRLGRVPVM